MQNIILTCVFCGMAYPAGTPPHGDQLLIDHIKQCPKHPLRKAEEENRILRKALERLVGAKTKDELEMMEQYVSEDNNSDDDDHKAALQGIRSLLVTLPKE